MAKDPTMGPVTTYDDQGHQEFVNVGDTPEQLPPPMRTVILAGGRGTRLMDETQDLIPKPMVKVGNKPMLQHIMDIYYANGFDSFLIAGGHKIEHLEFWYKELQHDFEAREVSVEVVDTGEDTQTGGRLLRLKDRLTSRFMMTYGDGLADVNIKALWEYHGHMAARRHCLVTLTAVKPPSRFGTLKLEDGLAKVFAEKSQSEEGWINGGFYVIEPAVFNMINGDMCRWEYDVLPVLASQNRLGAFKHQGYFQMCDTWRDLQELNRVYETGEAPWARFGTII